MNTSIQSQPDSLTKRLGDMLESQPAESWIEVLRALIHPTQLSLLERGTLGDYLFRECVVSRDDDPDPPKLSVHYAEGYLSGFPVYFFDQLLCKGSDNEVPNPVGYGLRMVRATQSRYFGALVVGENAGQDRQIDMLFFKHVIDRSRETGRVKINDVRQFVPSNEDVFECIFGGERGIRHYLYELFRAFDDLVDTRTHELDQLSKARHQLAFLVKSLFPNTPNL